MEIYFSAQVWLYNGPSAWHFVTIPEKESELILTYFSSHRKPFGSLPVKVIFDSITWNTSIFWDSKQNSFLLPIKQEIRRKTKISTGAIGEFTLSIDSL